MKRALTVLSALLLMAGVVHAQAGTPDILSKVAAKSANALAIIRFQVQDEIAQQTVAGLGICIDAEKGVLMSMALDPRIQTTMVKDILVFAPGGDSKGMKAELMGIDPETGISFITVAPSTYKWGKISFAAKSDLAVGKQVASVGLLDDRFGFQPYMGVGFVSAMLRVPGQLVYVTGGQLTAVGSPVFNEAGLAVGIVQQQLYSTMTLMGKDGKPMDVDVRSKQETSYFVPVEEFVQVFQHVPAKNAERRLSWLGVLNFNVVPENMRTIVGPDTDSAVVVGKVIPGTPADKAGLKDGDVVVGLNKQPLEKLAMPNLTMQNFVRQLMKLQVGDKVALTVLDPKGAKKEVEMVAEATPDRPDMAKKYVSARMGFVVREKVTLDRYLDASPTGALDGLYTILLVNEGPAAKGGLKADDLITAINGTKVKTVEDFKAAEQAALATDKPVNLVIQRGDQAMPVTVIPVAAQPAAPAAAPAATK